MKPSKQVQRMWKAIAEGKPELLDDLDMTRGNPRGHPRRKPEQREKKEVQQPLVIFLRKHLPLGSVVHAQAIQPVSENHRFAMQRDGVQFGMPDLLVIVPGPAFYFIEAKHPDGSGRLSSTQQHTQGLLEDMGCAVLRECTSAAQAVEWLQSKGVKFR